MNNTIKPGASVSVRNELTKTKTRKKSKPGDAPRAWLRRQYRAVYRILSAVSKGAEAARVKAADEIADDPYHISCWGARDRATRTREDEVYFEILDTVGRAAESAAARAAGYKTWAEYQSAYNGRSYDQRL